MFKGRIGVGQYWKSVLLLFLFIVVASGILLGLYYFILLPLLLKLLDTGLGTVILLSLGGMLLGLIPALVSLPYSIGLQIRRFHDIGLTGWMVLGLFILGWLTNFFFPALSYSGTTPVFSPVGVVIAVILTIGGIVIISWPGTKGSNKYGEPIRYSSLRKAIKGKV